MQEPVKYYPRIQRIRALVMAGSPGFREVQEISGGTGVGGAGRVVTRRMRRDSWQAGGAR